MKYQKNKKEKLSNHFLILFFYLFNYFLINWQLLLRIIPNKLKNYNVENDN